MLDRAKQRFTPRDRAVKGAAISALWGRPIDDRALLLRFHDALCFLRAYPDDPGLLHLVERALETTTRSVAALIAAGGVDADDLEETGLAGTVVSCPLSHPAARWLADRFPDAAEIDWDDPETETALGTLLPGLVALAEEEALVEAGVPYRSWLTAAKGRAEGSDLSWLLERLDRQSDRVGRRALYDQLQPRIRWELGESLASRTRAGVPVPRVFFHRGALVRWRGALARRLPGSRLRVTIAAPGQARALLDAARAAVIVRHREVHAFNFADPGAVTVGDAGRGVQIVWFGVRPAHRLPIRAHYGYLILKNGIPVGYGDASLLCEWVEIAYNIFEAFRRGESAFIFIRLMGFLHQHLGARAVHLSRYQIGHGNDEALESGAFWFYYKLGFRPKRTDLHHLALDERRRIAARATYRSPRATLERLCQDGMFVAVGRRAGGASRDFDVHRLGLRGAAHAGRQRRVTVTAALARDLGAARWRAWPRSEQVAFARLAPVLALIPDLPRWRPRERRALVEVIRAKGGPREADYLRRLQAHPRLRASLLRLGTSEGGSAPLPHLPPERLRGLSPRGRGD
ncbi:MAG: hypothetical protein ACRELA_24025 [Candidatus Rokuibacteriota bacterium]